MKKNKGVTLIELIIAVGVIAAAIAGVFTAFHFGFRTSSQAHDITFTSIEAQLQMESLLGRRWIGDLEYENWCSGTGGQFESNGLWIRLTQTPYATNSYGDVLLIQVTVYIYMTNTDAIANDWATRHRNIINVSGTIN